MSTDSTSPSELDCCDEIDMIKTIINIFSTNKYNKNNNHYLKSDIRGRNNQIQQVQEVKLCGNQKSSPCLVFSTSFGIGAKV